MLPLAALTELSEELMTGPGLRTRPAYDGSISRHAEWVPVVSYYGRPWFVRSPQGVLENCLRMALASGFQSGTQLAYEPGRNRRESDILKARGVPDIDVGASVGMHFELDHKFGPMPITLLARARQHIDNDRGAQVVYV